MIMKATPHRYACSGNSRGFLMTEMVIAMAILVIAVLPIGYSLINDTRVLRASYRHAVAMEIVDGEMEILAAGAWRSAPEGTHPYPVHAAAAENLPSGKFQLTRTGNHLRLEWKPDLLQGEGTVVREVTVK